MIKSLAFLAVASLLATCATTFTPQMPSQAAVGEARKHIDGMSGFYGHMNELRFGDDCGGYSEVYRLFILRTFSDFEVIRIGSRNGRSRRTHSIGHLGAAHTTTIDVDDAAYDRFMTKVKSSPFLAMDVWTGIWAVDADRYFFEWCSAGKYYAVERESRNSELGSVFQALMEMKGSDLQDDPFSP